MSDSVILANIVIKGVSTRICNFFTVTNYLHFISFLPIFAHILSWYTARSECTLHFLWPCILKQSRLWHQVMIWCWQLRSESDGCWWYLLVFSHCKNLSELLAKMYSVRLCKILWKLSSRKGPDWRGRREDLQQLPVCHPGHAALLLQDDQRWCEIQHNYSFKNCILTSGVPQTMARLRQEFGLKIGSSTGYTSEIMEKLRVGQCVSL